LQFFGFGRLHLGLGFRDLGGEFGRAEFGQQVALLDDAAAVHQDALDITRHPGVQRDREIRLDFSRQIDGAGHGFGDDGD
jgi:hypothetical protein